MPRKKNTKEIELNITGIGHKGTAVGRTDEGLVVFVRKAVPGDRIRALLYKKSKGVWQGQVREILQKSTHRTDAFCRHFGDCGGCSWQELSYAEQLRQKESQVHDAVKRLAGLEAQTFEPILAAPDTRAYRNKLEFTFSSHRWLTTEELQNPDLKMDSKALGFHRPESFSKVIDIQTCYLQDDINNRIRNFIRSYTAGEEWSYYDIKKQTGQLRNMIVRTNQKGEVMLALSVSDREDEKLPGLFDALRNEFPEIVSSHLAENKKTNDSWYDLECRLVFGEPALTEQLNHVSFRIGPKSFFQTNSRQTIGLYDVVKEYAALTGSENLYDLYCGVGSIGIYLAKDAAKLTGIEEVEAAVRDAHENAALNGIENAEFLAGDARIILDQELIARRGHPDVVIVDPPRTGLHADVVNSIMQFGPDRIVYVSCNPATLARDLKLFSEQYDLIKLRAVDMFPHTSHVEAVSLLVKKQNLSGT